MSVGKHVKVPPVAWNLVTTIPQLYGRVGDIILIMIDFQSVSKVICYKHYSGCRKVTQVLDIEDDDAK